MDSLRAEIEKELTTSGFFYKNINFSEEEFLEYSKNFNAIPQYGSHLHWFVEDKEEKTVKNLSKTSENLTAHMEGVHLDPCPRWVVLYCNESSSINFQTYLLDTSTFLKSLTSHDVQILKKLNFVFVDKEGKEDELDLITSNEEGIEYVHLTGRGYFKPKYLKGSQFSTSMEIYEYVPVLKKLVSFLTPPTEGEKDFVLQKGDLLIFDNRRFLHGRAAQLPGKEMSRKLIRVYAHNNLFREI